MGMALQYRKAGHGDREADQGFACLTLGCNLCRPALHRFYEANGFVHSGRVYSRWLGG